MRTNKFQLYSKYFRIKNCSDISPHLENSSQSSSIMNNYYCCFKDQNRDSLFFSNLTARCKAISTAWSSILFNIHLTIRRRPLPHNYRVFSRWLKTIGFGNTYADTPTVKVSSHSSHHKTKEKKKVKKHPMRTKSVGKCVC